MSEKTIIINDLLCFMVSKIADIPSDLLIKAMHEFYTKAEAVRAYRVLTKFLRITKAERRQRMNQKYDVFVSISRLLLNSKNHLPVFVCRDLNNIPIIRESLLKRYILKREHESIKKKINEVYYELSCLRNQFLSFFEGCTLNGSKTVITNSISSALSTDKETMSTYGSSASSQAFMEASVDDGKTFSITLSPAKLEESSIFVTEKAVLDDHSELLKEISLDEKSFPADNYYRDIDNLESMVRNEGNRSNEVVQKLIYQCHQNTHSGSYRNSSQKQVFEESSACAESDTVIELRKQYTCRICQTTYSSLKKLYSHKQTHGNIGLHCPLCAKSYPQVDWMDHVGLCRGNGVVGLTVKDIHCTDCNIFFANHRLLKLHRAFHDNSRPFECQQCSYRFYSKQSLVHHYRTHALENEWKYQCPCCPRAFPGARKLEYHMGCHTGYKPYKCDFCSFCATRYSGLQAHIRSHINVKDYKCKICCQSFKFKSKLNLHQKTHSEDRPFICLVCGKGFKTGQSMAIHHQNHTESTAKRYLCNIPDCNYTTRSNVAFAEHTNSHFNIKPHKCPNCDFAANQRSYLKVHLRKCLQTK